MGVLVSNGAAITFPAFAAQQIITAVRVQRASDNGQPVEKRLAAAVTVAANEQFNFPEGALDFKYNSGDYTDAHMRAVVESYWGSGGTLNMEIDLLEGADGSETVCNDTNYVQQSTNDWDVAIETDDSP